MRRRQLLLIRRGDQMILTPRAQRLANPLGAALASLRKLTTPDQSPWRPPAVTIAMRDQFVVALGPALLRRLVTLSPATTLRIVPYERERLADDLARGAIDIAVAVDPPNAPGLKGKLLYRESFVCLTPSRRPPTLADCLAARHIATTAHPGYEGIDAVLAKSGHQRTVAARVTYFAAAIHLAESLGLYVILPRRVARALNSRRLFAHPVPFALPGFAVTLVWDCRFDDEADHQWIRKWIAEAASET